MAKKFRLYDNIRALAGDYAMMHKDVSWLTIMRNDEMIRGIRGLYDEEYFTVEILSSGTFGIEYKINSHEIEPFVVYYKLNDGEWTQMSFTGRDGSLYLNGEYINVSQGDKILFKANRLDWKGEIVKDKYPNLDDRTEPIGFGGTAYFNVSGNIMSLIYGDNFIGRYDLPLNYNNECIKGTFEYLFMNAFYLVEAGNLVLPANNFDDSRGDSDIYYWMFDGCLSLVSAPDLPSTNLCRGCYRQMFDACESLLSSPKILPATTLATQCYYEMFYGCKSLLCHPQLPATTLAERCYYGMFEGCSSIVETPILPATTLAKECYSRMFAGCYSLVYAPELPATTLTEGCYAGMFMSCSSLTTAPTLPATTLVEKCYYYMFHLCTSLDYIKCLATDISANDCFYNWVNSVQRNGTFVKDANTTWPTATYNNNYTGIPSHWTIQNY